MEDLQRQIDELTRLVEQMQKELNITLILVSILVGAVVGTLVGVLMCKVLDYISGR